MNLEQSLPTLALIFLVLTVLLAVSITIFNKWKNRNRNVAFGDPIVIKNATLIKNEHGNMTFSIPGDSLKPVIPQNGIPMSNFTPAKTKKRYRYYTPISIEKNGVGTNWGVAKEVLLNYFSNGSALIINERGNPQRISKRCLQMEHV